MGGKTRSKRDLDLRPRTPNPEVRADVDALLTHKGSVATLERMLAVQTQNRLESVRSLATDIKEQMERLLRQINELPFNPDRPIRVNDLGELQGRGPRLDVACAAYQASADQLRDLRAAQKISPDAMPENHVRLRGTITRPEETARWPLLRVSAGTGVLDILLMGQGLKSFKAGDKVQVDGTLTQYTVNAAVVSVISVGKTEESS